MTWSKALAADGDLGEIAAQVKQGVPENDRPNGFIAQEAGGEEYAKESAVQDPVRRSIGVSFCP